MMRLSFILGAIHLSVAQVWQCVRYYPDLRSLNKLGCAVHLGDVRRVNMFVLQSPDLADAVAVPAHRRRAGGLVRPPQPPSPGDDRRWLGPVSLSMLSAFSDVISYVRLMAVGLSSVLAVSFNDMALSGLLAIDRSGAGARPRAEYRPGDDRDVRTASASTCSNSPTTWACSGPDTRTSPFAHQTR